MAKTAAKAKATPQASSRPTTSPKSAPAAESKLPASIVAALPTGAKIIEHVRAIEALLPALERDLKAAEKKGAPAFARAFVVFHRLNERMLSEEKALKGFKSLYKEVKELRFPAVLEVAQLDNVPLSEGWRVGVSHNWRASVVPGQKEAAFAYLQEIGKGDLIQPTLNASTLSAFARQTVEQDNKELPADLFNVAQVPNTSVTKTK